jgi:hypothetical protein
MLMIDGHGLPLSTCITSATTAEVHAVIGRVKTSHGWARQNPQVYKVGSGTRRGGCGTSFFADGAADCKEFSRVRGGFPGGACGG